MGILWQSKKLHFGKPLSFTNYYVEDGAVCKTSGLIHIVEDQVQLYRVLDIQLRQDILDKLFNQGTIVLYTSDKNNKEFVLEKVHNPNEVKRKLNMWIEKARREINIRTGELINSNNNINYVDTPNSYGDDNNGYY